MGYSPRGQKESDAIEQLNNNGPAASYCLLCVKINYDFNLFIFSFIFISWRLITIL